MSGSLAESGEHRNGNPRIYIYLYIKVNSAITRIHENLSDQTYIHKRKNLSFDELLTTNYFFNVIYLNLVALLDFFNDFYFFLGVGVNLP